MSSVNFLEKLLGGVAVEWLPLGKVAKYSDSRIDFTYVNQGNYVGVDNLVQNRAGKQNSSYVPTDGRLIEYRKGDILIGNIRPYLKKIWLANNSGGASGDVLVIRSTHKSLSSEYLHQVLTDDKFFAYNMQHAKGAKMPRGDKAKILEYSIPIPCPDNPKKSLEIQAEIVRILDTMTAHTAELTAELTARKKQYNYYRDKLLSFEDGEVEWKTLDEISKKISSGGTPPTSISEYYDGDIPWLRTQEVDFREIWDTGVKITEAGLENSSAKWIPENCVIIAMYGATVGKIGINKIPMTTNQACANIQLNENIANYRYIFHYLVSQYEYIKSLGTGSQTNINAKIVKNLKVPIPFFGDPKKSLAEQYRIASILDKFHLLVTSITEGLPREIELREKQYAYYRDLLLSFPQAQTA